MGGENAARQRAPRLPLPWKTGPLRAVVMSLSLAWGGPALASFDVPPPAGAGPVADQVAVVEGTPALAVFHNPALLHLTEGGFLGAAGGALFGLAELRRSALGAGCVLGGTTVAIGVASLGDSLYRENLYCLGGGRALTERLALGLSLELGEVLISSRRPSPGMGFLVGLALELRGWRAGGVLHLLPRGKEETRTFRLTAGLRRSLPAGACLAVAHRRGARAADTRSFTWLLSLPLGSHLELRGTAEMDGSLGAAVRIEREPMEIIVSSTSHPLLGETPEGGIAVKW